MLSLAMLLLLLLYVLPVLAGQAGHCAMYGTCGKRSVFGQQLPCPVSGPARKPSSETIDILHRVCGPNFPTDTVCCSQDQVLSLEASLKRVDPLVSSCPACRQNFYDFFCNFTCSSDQSTFAVVTKNATAVDTHADVVAELAQYVDPTFAQEFYDSCKNVKFSATNGYAMDLIGGGATNFREFLKFLGDEKPLLGGSPFQINYVYDVAGAPEGTELRTGHMRACDDPSARCACSDCPGLCPELPHFRPLDARCTVAGMPCFSFAVVLVWVALIVGLGVYHMVLARKKRAAAAAGVIQVESDGDEDPVPARAGGVSYVSYASYERARDSARNYLSKPLGSLGSLSSFRSLPSLDAIFASVGLFCARAPGTVIGASLAASALLASGLFHAQLETDPVNLWVSPNEPALQNKQFFEQNFGEWYRIEQIIISNPNGGPVLDWDSVQWWFAKEQELFTLNGLHLEDFCFKPLGDSCIVESFTQYFQGDINYLTPTTWKSKLTACTESPVNCLPSFQQPLNKNILFSSDNVLESEAFTITLLLNSNLSNAEYTEKVENYEQELKLWLFNLQKESHLQIDFSTEVSLTEELNKSTNTDVKIVVVSYLVMFIYASLALGGRIPTSFSLKNLVHTRFQLGLGGIVIILLSVASSAGVFSFLGLKSTLIIAEVIPFLVLAVGIDNIFLIVHELHLETEKNPLDAIPARISRTLARIGPSCLISALLQVLMFLLATRVDMPAVKNFAFYSAGAILFNFLLQMTGFVSLLAIDQARVELGRVDCFPWIQVPIQLSSDPEHIEYNFSNFIRHTYGPWLFKLPNRRKIITFFVVWLGVSLSLLPGIQFGLDQRIAIPTGSYLISYFNSVYRYLNVGPPVFFVVKDFDVTQKANQKALCGKFGACNEFSLANILEQEYQRVNFSSIAEPTSNWLDDFLTWLNPDLDQCCRLKKSDLNEFCLPNAPERQCQTCYADHSPPYSTDMEAFPESKEFMKFFNHWIDQPSDPCPLGGKAPYLNSISVNSENSITASYFRTSHTPLRSQDDFIFAYKNSRRIVDELERYEDVDVFAFSPFYIFFVQYETIVRLTFTLLAAAAVIIWLISVILLGSVPVATALVATVGMVLVNIAGVMSLWNISLNAVSLVNLVICAGLAVEFTIHISRAYLLDEDEDEELFNSFMVSSNTEISDEKAIRSFDALCKVGGSVLGGITITKFIGISVLAFTKSKIFEVYYFRMWLSLVVVAAVHALVFLPVLLSYVGGKVSK